MDFLMSLFSGVSGSLGYVIPFLFVLTVVVFFHELGHFWVARKCGVAVEAFSIGFGPELWGFNDKHGTRWKLSALPLGGYVKFLGDENEASAPQSLEKLKNLDDATKSKLFPLKPVWQRAAVVAAGPIANFLLTIAIFTLLYSLLGKTFIEPKVGEVMPDTPAAQAGFVVGDVIVDVDGRKIRTFSDIQRMVATSNGRPMSFHIRRNAEEMTLQVNPRKDTTVEKIGGKQEVWRVGLKAATAAQDAVIERYNLLEAFVLAVKETGFLIERTLLFIGDLFVGQAPIKELGGPIRIAEVSGQAAGVSFTALISLTALLSVSIGLLNLFPIPMLDGGHLLFYAIEAIKGSPLSEKAQEFGYKIGMAFVMMLMVVATWNDITRLFFS